MLEKSIKGYKGFDKNLSCQKFQYEIGKTVEINQKSIRCTSNGFHFCENPIDIFEYYPPGRGNRFCRVEGFGDTDYSVLNTKIAVSKLKIIHEVDFKELIQNTIKFISKHVAWGKSNLDTQNTWFKSGVQVTGARSGAQITGIKSGAQATGYRSGAQATGDNSSAQVTEYNSGAQVVGNSSVGQANGPNSGAQATGRNSGAQTTRDNSGAQVTGRNSGAHATGNNSSAQATGDNSVSQAIGSSSGAQTTGDDSVAQAIGNNSNAQATGRNSVAQISGNGSIACTNGFHSKSEVKENKDFKNIDAVAVAVGYKAMARASLGCWLVLAEWHKSAEHDQYIKNLQTVKVDGVKIKANTWYVLKDGLFVTLQSRKK